MADRKVTRCARAPVVPSFMMSIYLAPVVSCLCLLSGAAISPALSVGQDKQGKLVIQDFFPQIYDRNRSRHGNQTRPSIFDLVMSDVYKENDTFASPWGKWCPWHKFRHELAAAKDGPKRHSAYFSQFDLEAILIRRWLTTRFEPTGPGMVIVPSYTFHLWWNGFPGWTLFSSGRDTINDPRGSMEQLHKYWSLIRHKYYRPENNYTPLIVIHYSFAWDSDHLDVIRALLGLDRVFAQRVVIVSIDGPNLARDHIKEVRQALGLCL